MRRVNVHLKGLQNGLDAGAVHLNAVPKAVGGRLDDDVPLNVAQRAIGRRVVPPVALEEVGALVDRGVEVADDVEQRVGVPSHLTRAVDAVGLERLLRLGDDAREEAEALGEVADFGAELGVLGSWVRATLAVGRGSRGMTR